MTIRRSMHWTDQPGGVGRQRRRSISNYCNWQSPSGVWAPTEVAVGAAQGVPTDWSGQFDFSMASQAAPLQVYFRDAMDVGNRAMVGMRRSDKPGSWLNLKALDIAQAVDAVQVDAQTVEWPGLWTNTTLRFRHVRARLDKEIVLAAPGHPASFAFTVHMPPSHAMELAGNAGTVRDGSGDAQLLFRAPYGTDANGSPIRVTLEEDAARGGFRVLRLTPNPDDLAWAVYPVVIDPTTTISGTTDIVDNYGYISSPTSNIGGWHTMAAAYTAANNRANFYCRISEGAFPAGTIDNFTWYATEVLTSSRDTTAQIYLIESANNWTEGGSCWRYKYGTTNWAGGQNGCGVSGTDYVADATPPTITFTTASFESVTASLKTAWATDWRDAAVTNNGFLCKYDSLDTNNTLNFGATEHATNPLYFDVDYTAGGSSYYYNLINRVRR